MHGSRCSPAATQFPSPPLEERGRGEGERGRRTDAAAQNVSGTRATEPQLLAALNVPAASVAEALAALQNHRVALTVLDWGLDRCGSEVLRESKTLYPQMPVIVMSGRPYDVRTDAIVGQADTFLMKPFSATVLKSQK